jgi:hypothetical protein
MAFQSMGGSVGGALARISVQSRGAAAGSTVDVPVDITAAVAAAVAGLIFAGTMRLARGLGVVAEVLVGVCKDERRVIQKC